MQIQVFFTKNSAVITEIDEKIDAKSENGDANRSVRFGRDAWGLTLDTFAKLNLIDRLWLTLFK